METLEFQSAMARLYCERELREQLYRADSSGLANVGLRADECMAIIKVAVQNRSRLELFAGIALRKRAMEFAATLPLCASALGQTAWLNACEDFWKKRSISHECTDEFTAHILKFARADQSEQFSELLEIECTIAKIERIGSKVQHADATILPSSKPKLLDHAVVIRTQFEYASLRDWARSEGKRVPIPMPGWLLLLANGADLDRVEAHTLSDFLAQFLVACNGHNKISDLVGCHLPPDALIRACGFVRFFGARGIFAITEPGDET